MTDDGARRRPPGTWPPPPAGRPDPLPTYGARRHQDQRRQPGDWPPPDPRQRLGAGQRTTDLPRPDPRPRPGVDLPRAAGRPRPGVGRAPRRRHPAQGARIVAAGASVAAVLGITAALGVAQHAGATPAPSSSGGSSGPTTESTVRPPTAEPARPAPFFPSGPPDATTHGSR